MSTIVRRLILSLTLALAFGGQFVFNALADIPAITTQPVGVSVCPGSPAQFSVTATGTEPLSYQWYFNETNSLVDQTNATLALNNVQSVNAGSYSVVITNAEGAVTSVLATLTANAPTTASALANVANACPGTPVSFSTTAGGTGTLAFKWFKNDVEIPDATTATYSIAAVTSADAGTYKVAVTGDCGSVTNSATLTVAAIPAITAQPQSANEPMGNTATFSVTATGFSPTYQWQVNEADIAGATSASFTTPTLSLADLGKSYRVIVSNCAGSVTSAVATLTVRAIAGVSFDFDTPGQYTNAPYYIVNNNFLNSSFNTPVTVFESPVGGTGPFPGSGALDMIPNNGTDNTAVMLPLSYDFSQDGKTLVASIMVKMKAPTSNNRLLQLGFQTSTNSTLTGADRNAFMTVRINSTAQPALTYQMEQQHKVYSGTATLQGNAPAAVTLTAGNWYKFTVTFVNKKGTAANTFNVSSVLKDMGPNGTTPGADVSTIAPVDLVNADVANAKAMYLAFRAFENCGNDFMDNLMVSTAVGPVTFVAPPASQTVQQGQTVTFKALVDGDGPYTYQWNKNGTPIPGARSWNYITPPVTLADNGAQYTVDVTGPANTETSEAATLTVTPVELAVASVGSVDGNNVGLRFNQPVDPTTAQNPVNYSINGTAAAAAVLRPDGKSVLLTPASVVSGAFTVAVQNVVDLSGGALGSANSASGSVAGLIGYDVNPFVTAPPGANYSFAPGQFEVTGGGTDIWNQADGFRFVYTTKSGDFDIKAKVPYMDVVNGSSKAGFNVRASLDAASPMVHAAVNPIWPGRNYPEGGQRIAYNIAATSWGNTPQLTYPNVWLRLRRTGNTFMRYTSTDGIAWRFDGQTSVVLPETVYVGLEVCPSRNNNFCRAIFENFGDFVGYAGSTIAITTQPTSVTGNAGGNATLTIMANATGAPTGGELSFVWQRSNGAGVWTNVPNAGAAASGPTSGINTNTLTVGPLSITDNGAEFRAIVRLPGAADVISDVVTVTVNDTTAPTLVSATVPALSIYQVVLKFSEKLASANGTFTVTNAAGTDLGVVSAAFLDGDFTTIVLTTTIPFDNGLFGVVASGLQDLAGNALAANSVAIASAAAAPIQPVVIEVYQDISSTDGIPVLTGHAIYTPGTPTYMLYSDIMGFNTGIASSAQDNYGLKAYTLYVPPSTGLYKFWVRNDDDMELWMNTNAVDSANPTGKVKIGEVTSAQGNYTVRAQNIQLTGGQEYYLELLLKENTGNDGFSLVVRPQSDGSTPANTVFTSTGSYRFPSALNVAPKAIFEFYTGQSGSDLPSLQAATNLANFVTRTPNLSGYQKYLAVQPGLQHSRFDNYAGRIYSYFVAPSNGLYRFWIRSDDANQFWMNTNAVNSTDPAGMVMLASQNAYNAAYATSVQNVRLVAGQRYYIEGRWKDGTGGDGITIAVRSQGDSATPPATEWIQGSMLEFPAALAPVGAVTFTSVTPVNPVVSDGQTVTLSAMGVKGASPIGYVWLKNGQQVFANSATYTTLPLGPSDNGAVYTLLVTNLFSRIERSVTVTVVPDATKPTLVSAVGSRLNNGVVLTFSESLDAQSALYIGNYQVAGLAITSAALDQSRTKVTLTTTPQTPGTTYTMTINGVRDASSTANVIAANTTATFSAWGVGGGGFLVELFTNITGGAIIDLVGNPKFVNDVPDVIGYVNSFFYNSTSVRLGNFGPFASPGYDNYGARVSGFFVPQNTGFYRFYLGSDDTSQFWMNINATGSEDPAGKVMLSHVYGANLNYGHVVAATPVLPLNAGQRYYVEALMKEGTGGDYVRVAFRETDAAGVPLNGMPADTEFAPASAFDGVLGNPDWAAVVAPPPAEVTAAENEPVTLMLGVSMPPYVQNAATFQWQKYDSAASTFTNIPGATSASYLFYMGAIVVDEGAQLKVRFSAPGRSAEYVTTLHVSENDTTPPTIVSVNSLDGTSVGITFSERVSPGPATDSVNFSFNNGASYPGDGGILMPDGKSVWFPVDAALPLSGAFEVYAQDISDLAAEPNRENSTGNGEVENLMAMDIGAVGLPGFTFTSSKGNFDIKGGGADIWGAADAMQFVTRQVTGNFDVKVRVQSLTMPDVWAKAGLMARATTNANSRNIAMLVAPRTGQNTHTFQWRDTDGGNTDGIHKASVVPGPTNTPAYPNAWIRLQRVGSVLTGYFSADGTNWTANASRNTALGAGGALPETLYLGMAVTAHLTALTNTATAEFRDLYFPMPPTITTQPESVTLSVRGSATLTVAASTPENTGTLTYQWRKDGIDIPGANSATLAINNASVMDAGSYQVLVGNDGGAVSSTVATVTVNNALPVVANEVQTIDQNQQLVLNASALIANDSDPEGDAVSLIAVSGMPPVTFATDFNSGEPTNATRYGVAAVEATGGVDNSGTLMITPASGSQVGSYVVNELTPGKRVSAFSARFKVRVNQTSSEPADGFSFNFAPNLPNGTSGGAEEGVGSGISFGLKNYRFTGGANTAGFKLKYGGVLLASVQTPVWNSPNYIPVEVTMTADGVLSVKVNGTNVFGNVTIPYVPTVGRFGFFARTGGQYQAHYLDDVSMTVYTLDTARETDLGANKYGTTYIKGGFLHITDNANDQAGAFVLRELTPGRAINSFDASFKLRIGDGTSDAADGFSFNLAADLPNGTAGGEEGVGSGLSICVDNYPGAGPDAPALKVKYAGTQLALVVIPKWNSTNWVPVQVTLDSEGFLDLIMDGTNVVENLATSYQPIVGRFGFYARTGGQNQTHWVDDLAINVVSGSITRSFTSDFSVDGAGTVVLSNGVVTYTPPANTCGTDQYYYIVSDGQVGGESVGTVTVNLSEVNPTAPQIAVCAPDLMVPATSETEGVLPDLTLLVAATDNCSFTITQSPAAGTLVPIGNTTVTITVTDAANLTATCQATVTVLVPAAITAQPVSQVKAGGSSVTFSVTATGTALTYQWRKNGTNISGANAAELTLSNITADDAAAYTVVVANAGSSVTSDAATLRVIVPVVMPKPGFNLATGDLSLSITTVVGQTYKLWSTESLTPPVQWTEVQTIVGDGAAQAISLPTSGSPAKFYRVSVE